VILSYHFALHQFNNRAAESLWTNQQHNQIGGMSKPTRIAKAASNHGEAFGMWIRITEQYAF
jgi:hypothetical protein